MTDSRLVELQKVYDSIPRLACKKECPEVCITTMELSQIEEINIRLFLKKRGREWVDFKDFGDFENHMKRIGRHSSGPNDAYSCSCLRCPYLTSKKLCSIYPVRPLVCRLYGVYEGMRCRHGCQPEQAIDELEMRYLYERVWKILGESAEPRDPTFLRLMQEGRIRPQKGMGLRVTLD
jgi:Fe-S-cluster containining protein